MFKALTPFLSIITAIVVGFFFVKPMYEDIKSIQAETTQYRDAVAKASESNRKLQELLQKKNSFSAGELERVDLIAPDVISQVRVLVDLENLAKKHNMLFGNVVLAGDSMEDSSSDSESAENLETSGSLSFDNDFVFSDISFGLIGSYEQFLSILSDLERSLSIMEIIKLDFVSLPGNLQQYDLVIRVYGLKGATLE